MIYLRLTLEAAVAVASALIIAADMWLILGA